MSIGKYFLDFRSSLIQSSTDSKESEMTYFTLRALRMEAASSFETTVSIYQTTCCRISEHLNSY